MKFVIYLVFLGSFSVLVNGTHPDEIEKSILGVIQNEGNSHPYLLKLHHEGLLGKTETSIVWKGDFNGIPVAFKLTAYQSIYQVEIEGYAALNAINNVEIEKHGIPNVYYHGQWLGYPYWGIAMSLFEGNLEDRHNELNKNISEMSILLLFKRGVQILEYLNKMHVLHNDIKPGNIFLRGPEVFFGDFSLASRDHQNSDTGYCSYPFASSGFYLKKIRTPMDDLESLVFSLWYVAGIQWDKTSMFGKERRPEGKALAEYKKNGNAKAKMMAKCRGFKNKHVQKAFKLIAAGEMLTDKHAPDYNLLSNILEEAIRNVHNENSVKIQFEWLPDRSYEDIQLHEIVIQN